MGTPCFFMAARAFSFSPISRITSGVRSDELDVACLADFREVGVFRQQTVTGMNGVHIGDLGRADDGGNIEIALRELRRSDADRLIGKAHVQGVPVCFAVDCHRANAEFLARANDAQRDLAAIGY